MTDRQSTDNTPLFQNVDEQEAVYAPQQLPGNNMPGIEVDQGGSVGEAAAGAVAATNAGLVGNPGGVTSASGPGMSGAGAVAPVIPVRSNASADDAGAATGSDRL